MTSLSPGQWNGALRRCTWGLTAIISLRIFSPRADHRHRGPLTWVTGSRPTPQVALPTWFAGSSIPVGFLLVARLVRPLASLKCSFYELERTLCRC
jgi:hypothetical protein